MESTSPPLAVSRSLRVLLVSHREEDFFQIREMLRRAQQPMEAVLDHARSLHEASLLMGKSTYDLLLIDYDIGGVATVEMLSKMFGAGSMIPFVFLTQDAEESVISEIIQAGAWDWMERTRLDNGVLARALRATLTLHTFQQQHRKAEEQV